MADAARATASENEQELRALFDRSFDLCFVGVRTTLLRSRCPAEEVDPRTREVLLWGVFDLIEPLSDMQRASRMLHVLRGLAAQRVRG